MYYIPKYFQPYEVVPKSTFLTLKPYQIWRLFDPRTLWTMDQLRQIYGKMLMNTWHWGGEHQFRGWRPFNCGIGAPLSQHRFGRASDMEPLEVTAEEIRQDIIADKWPVVFQHITCIETGVPWLHQDQRNYEGLLIIAP